MPMRVSLFNAERVDGSVGSVDEAVRSSGLHHVSVDGHARLVGDVQLPTHLTDEADPESKDLNKSIKRKMKKSKSKMICFDVLLQLHQKYAYKN